MDAPYKSAILALRPKLQVNLIVDHFLALLHQDCEGFLNDFEEDDVKSTRGKVKKVTVLLDILVKKDNEAFHKFCRVLERSNNRVWSDKLRTEASSSESPCWNVNTRLLCLLAISMVYCLSMV